MIEWRRKSRGIVGLTAMSPCEILELSSPSVGLYLDRSDPYGPCNSLESLALLGMYSTCSVYSIQLSDERQFLAPGLEDLYSF